MDRLMPANVDAEVGLLGSVFISPSVLLEVAEYLRAEDFYRTPHRDIYRVAQVLMERGEAVDLITVTDELTRRGELEGVGGASYVSALTNAVPTSAHADHYARIVARTALQRRLVEASGRLAALAYEDLEVAEAVEGAERLVREATDRAVRGETRPPADDVAAVLDRLDAQRDRAAGAPVGVPTGSRDLDLLVGGWRRGDLYLLAGRPAMGKSGVALWMARQAEAAGYPVFVASLEMAREEVVERWLAAESGVPMAKVRDGGLSDDEWERLASASGRIGAARLLLDATPGMTLPELRGKARRAVAAGARLVVVDYLQLLETPAGRGRRDDTREREVAAISRGLKALAKELAVPVLALSQLSRQVEGRADKRPQLSDLRESGALEQDADAVILLYREGAYDAQSARRNLVDLHVAKHRQGPTGTVSLYWRPEVMDYYDVAWQGAGAGTPVPAPRRPVTADVGAGMDGEAWDADE